MAFRRNCSPSIIPPPALRTLRRRSPRSAKPHWVGLDRDQWGLDHGTWSVLAHLYPDADVPVVQLSINALKPLDYHLELGARLAPLRDRGVMILASGNVVHNLRRVQWDRPDAGFDWAASLRRRRRRPARRRSRQILELTDHPDFALAVPTPDHFIPLLYLAGVAAAEGKAEPLVRGYALGSLSMTCYGVGTDVKLADDPVGAAGLPAHVPPDQTNV